MSRPCSANSSAAAPCARSEPKTWWPAWVARRARGARAVPLMPEK